MRILPVVVIYNENFFESNVYLSLLKFYSTELMVLYDNSSVPLSNKYPDNILYYHNPQNGGVSGGYNYAASVASKIGNVEALLLLDQDTIFPSDYINQLDSLLEEKKTINLFVPQVVYKKYKCFSPVKRGRFRSSATFVKGLCSLKEFLPVNSGVCVRLNSFLEVGGYNPDIKLDFSDFDFFSRLCEKSSHFYVVESRAVQNFSNDDIDISRLILRFHIYIEGGKCALKNKLIRKEVIISMIRHTIALSIRTKSSCFLFYFIKHFHL